MGVLLHACRARTCAARRWNIANAYTVMSAATSICTDVTRTGELRCARTSKRLSPTAVVTHNAAIQHQRTCSRPHTAKEACDQALRGPRVHGQRRAPRNYSQTIRYTQCTAHCVGQKRCCLARPERTGVCGRIAGRTHARFCSRVARQQCLHDGFVRSEATPARRGLVRAGSHAL